MCLGQARQPCPILTPDHPCHSLPSVVPPTPPSFSVYNNWVISAPESYKEMKVGDFSPPLLHHPLGRENLGESSGHEEDERNSLSHMVQLLHVYK